MIQTGTFCPEQMETSLCAVDTAAEKAGLDKKIQIKLRLLIEYHMCDKLSMSA